VEESLLHQSNEGALKPELLVEDDWEAVRFGVLSSGKSAGSLGLLNVILLSVAFSSSPLGSLKAGSSRSDAVSFFRLIYAGWNAYFASWRCAL